MARRRVHVFRMASGWAVAAAVIRRAQMRAAFDDLAGNLGCRQAGIVTSFQSPSARVVRNAARLRRVGRMLGRPPVGRPFPDIADHVVDAVAVRRKSHHRRGAIEAVLALILVGEIALPGIGHVLATGRELVAPGEIGAVEAAARRKFPLGLGRQILVRPFGVGQRVRISDVDDRMVVQAVDVAFRPVGMPPIRALQISPPLAEVSQVDRTIWRRENQRATPYSVVLIAPDGLQTQHYSRA
jgi:hypothetical protein